MWPEKLLHSVLMRLSVRMMFLEINSQRGPAEWRSQRNSSVRLKEKSGNWVPGERAQAALGSVGRGSKCKELV